LRDQRRRSSAAAGHAQSPEAMDPGARLSWFADAIPEYEAVPASNPNDVCTLAHLGWCKFITGAEDERIPLWEKAIRLSPRDLNLCLWFQRIGTVDLFSRASTKRSSGSKEPAAAILGSFPRTGYSPPLMGSRTTRTAPQLSLLKPGVPRARARPRIAGRR
jgi:hypothetical protein